MDIEEPPPQATQDRPELRREHGVRFRAVLLFGLLELVRDRVQGLVPGDALERALPLGPRPLHGVLEAVGGVDELGPGKALGAQGGGAADPGVESARVALHADEPTVPYMTEDGTGGTIRPATVTEGGDDMLPFDSLTGRWRIHGLLLFGIVSDSITQSGRMLDNRVRGIPMAGAKHFDFDNALSDALPAIDIGPHCSCADITMELLRIHLPLRWGASRYAAAAFGGGVGGSGGPCGAFSAGLIALSLFAGQSEPPGCIAELVEERAQEFYDAWVADQGSIMCCDLTGYPSMRTQEARDEFFAGGGVEECTQKRIRFAVETILALAGPTGSAQ